MEFREYIVDYFKKENKTINIKSFLQKYTESFETDIDIIQYIQVIGLIRNRDSKIDFITRMVNAYNNRSLLGEISQISTEFDKMKISSHIYSYFLYCVVNALDIETERIYWVDPRSNGLIENLYTDKSNQTFGTGSYIDNASHYEMKKDNLSSIPSSQRFITIPKGIKRISKEVFNQTVYMRFLTIPEDIKVLPSKLFERHPTLEIALLPDNITTIPNSFFSYCSSLLIVYAKNVKVIEEEAFMGSNISTMKFLNGSNIEIIHKNAFKGCSNLKEVNIRNCKKIHNTAFEACGNINKITISISKEAVEKGLRFYQIFSKNLNRFNKDYSKLRHVVIYTNQGTIPTSYFEGCTNLESITIVGIIDQLGEKVFKDCVNLEKIVMDNKLQKISKETFKNCDKLSSNFEFSNVELIEESAFENCNKLTQVVFLRKINKIEKSAFKNCSTLNELEMDFIGDQLAEDSFNNCSSLTNYDFLKNVTEINSYALANMNFSNEFKWPVNLEKIHKNAFYKSTFGKELVFPSNVDIEDLAFCNTKGYEVLEMGLVKIPSEKFLPHKYFSSSISEFNANFSFIKYLKITSGIVLESQFAGWENITKVIFTKTIKKIEDSTFENCINLEAILFSNDDLYIGKKAFKNCHNLSRFSFENYKANDGELFLPNTLKVEEEAFCNCKKFKVLNLNLSSSIGNNAFYNLVGLEELNLKLNADSELNRIHLLFEKESKEFASKYVNLSNVNLDTKAETINDSFFEDGVNFKSITINGTINSIGKAAFKNCKSLKTLKMDYVGILISDETFYGCSSLEKIPSLRTVKIIEPSAFTGCNNLMTLDIENLSVPLCDIFRDCRNLNTINYYGNTIPNKYFSRLSSIRTVSLINNVVDISESAFEDCTSLVRVTNLDNIQSLGSFAFKNTGIDEITIPKTIKNMGMGVFEDAKNLRKLDIPIRFHFLGSLFGVNESDNMEKIIQTNGRTEKIFYLPKTLDTVVLSDGVLSKGIFSNLNTNIIINHSVEFVPDYAFYNTHKFQMKFNSIKSIGNYAFAKSGIESANLTSVVNISDYAFASSKLNSISIGKDLDIIGELAFYDIELKSFKVDNNRKYEFINGIFYGKEKGNIIYVPKPITPNLVIPDNVLEISEKTFSNMEEIVSINTNKVHTIKKGAFANCFNLNSFTTTKHLKQCEEGILEGCSNIQKLQFECSEQADKLNISIKALLGETVITDKIDITITGEIIANNLLQGIASINVLDISQVETESLSISLENMEIDRLILPNTLKRVVDDFLKGTKVNEIIINDPSPYCFIDNGSLYIDDKLILCYISTIKNLIVHPNTRKITENALLHCSSFNSITLPDNIITNGSLKHIEKVKNITIGATHNETIREIFTNSANTIEVVDFTGTVVPKEFFSGLEKLIFVSLKNVSTINEKAFVNSKNLVYINDMDKVTTIGAKAFENCQLIKALYLSSKIEKIDKEAFLNTKIKQIAIADNKYYVVKRGMVFDLVENAILYVSEDVKPDLEIKEPLTTIYSHVFQNNDNIQSLCFNDVDNIEQNAFANCSNLKKLVIMKAKHVGSNILLNSPKISEIKIPFIGETKEEAGHLSYLFDGKTVNKELMSIELFDFEIMDKTFQNCSSIKEIILAENTKEIKTLTFGQCKSLRKLTIPTQVNKIEALAFKDCSLQLKLYVGNNNNMSKFDVDWNKTADRSHFSTLQVVEE